MNSPRSPKYSSVSSVTTRRSPYFQQSQADSQPQGLSGEMSHWSLFIAAPPRGATQLLGRIDCDLSRTLVAPPLGTASPELGLAPWMSV